MEECVYDQTKLVVIREEYRELTLNERFNEYASHARFNIRVCEGYDPESKGKVEAGVKYVKGNALYGESFDDWPHLRSYLSGWLDTIANVRIHGTTGIAPQVLYERDERNRMQSYLTPALVDSDDLITRKVDKTGLISWKSNKYSVPMAYQRCSVGVRDSGAQLHVDDLETGLEITCHTVCPEKGIVIRNTDHYRDRTQQISDYEQAIGLSIGNDYGSQLCALLKITSPKIYKDQLAGAGRILTSHAALPVTVLDRLLSRPRLTASGLRDYLDAYAEHSERLQDPQLPPLKIAPDDDVGLARYAGLTAQEKRHEFH